MTWSGLLLGLAAALIPAPASADTELHKLVHVCDQCHGENGNSQDDLVPSLAEIRPDYFIGAMGDFAAGYRPARRAQRIGDVPTDMGKIAARLSEAEIEALAYHYSDQAFVAREQDHDPELAHAGRQLHDRYCERCHTHGGSSAESGAAVLAGQPMGYLRYTFENFLSGKRYVSKKMRLKFAAMQRKAGDGGIEKLVHFYASRR